MLRDIIYIYIIVYTIASRELTYFRLLEKENHLQKCIGRGFMLVPRSTCIQQKHMRCRPSLRRSPQRECEYIAEFYVINREKLTC